MSAFPDPPSTPPRGPVNPTSATPTGMIDDMESDDFYDSTSSSDDELIQGPSKKVKLTPRDSAGDAVKNDTPVPAKGAASPKDGTLTEGSVHSEGKAPASVPADTDAECLVATPPPTSPPLGPREDTTVAVPGDSLPATTVPDAPSAGNEPPASRESTPSEPFCATNYPIFDPDDSDYEFGDYDATVFTEPYAYRQYMLERQVWRMVESRITRHLQDCLRGSALTWYQEELNDEEREDLRDGSLEDWVDSLCDRFSRPPEDHLEKIKENPLDLTVVRASKNIDYWLDGQFKRADPVTDEHWEALHMVWESIDPELRKDVPEPDSDSCYVGFLWDLEHAHVQWRLRLGLPPMCAFS
ncbi:uncharacterized protein N7496_003850 [Penicillium cataractarum]|uniref:Uncharacterized protein n=1 Tax=Penicillium cataractarum TaxID=2100454 RepID=A0A9W9SN94_9EURO|nr:uncharacterized protein N7496_003850 [Penicillium cataractarum]KAJ5381422.1 hypothetical protein N7496_003850 [Penicillium cataractarum]